jgi:hypothetical protein
LIVLSFRALAVLALGIAGPVSAMELESGTLQAWNNYIRIADSHMQARLDGQRPFLWADEVADRRFRLQRGEILVAPVSGRGTQAAPNGLIHDWVGAVFIPHATVETFLAVANDYNSYKEIYKPAVADSKLLACTDQDRRYSLVLQRRVLFVNAAVEGQYQVRNFAVDDRRGYSITATTRMQEIEDYGRSDARRLPPGHGDGFIWRLHSIVRYAERDGGLYLEVEAIALTRDIPASLRWVVKPVVNHLSIDSLTASLRETRDAVHSLGGHPGSLVSCAGGSRNSAQAAKPKL